MSSGSGPMLELKDVSLSFHSKRTSFEAGLHRILNSVSFKLADGETLGIIGKNGAGKTTMLRVMAGIIAPDSGTVYQKEGATSALLTLGLGFKPNLSGRDNATIAAMLQGASYRQAVQYLAQIKEFSELGDSFEEPVKTYSAGMKSRLGFSTALFTHVDIMLIDEVLSVGDAHFREKAQQALSERIIGDQTVVFVSHSHGQVRQLCDRVLWLDEGVITCEGEPEVVLKQYQVHIDTLSAP